MLLHVWEICFWLREQRKRCSTDWFELISVAAAVESEVAESEFYTKTIYIFSLCLINCMFELFSLFLYRYGSTRGHTVHLRFSYFISSDKQSSADSTHSFKTLWTIETFLTFIFGAKQSPQFCLFLARDHSVTAGPESVQHTDNMTQGDHSQSVKTKCRFKYHQRK